MSDMDARSGDLVDQPHDQPLEQLDQLDQEAAEEGGSRGLAAETPEADAAEQHAALNEQSSFRSRRVPFDVDEADAADQERVVELDEDDYR